MKFKRIYGKISKTQVPKYPFGLSDGTGSKGDWDKPPADNVCPFRANLD